MLKRVRWLGVGAVIGVGGSVYAQVALRRRARRWRPGPVLRRAGTSAATELRGAVSEGRRAMVEREGELRDRLGRPQR